MLLHRTLLMSVVLKLVAVVALSAGCFAAPLLSCVPLPMTQCRSGVPPNHWGPGETMNVTSVWQECGVPADARRVSLGWTASMYSDSMQFEALDAQGEVVGTYVLGTFCPATAPEFGPGGLPPNSPIAVPASTVALKYVSTGECSYEVKNLYFAVYGWC